MTIDARIVIASVDTYLRFAEAVKRLDLAETQLQGLPELQKVGAKMYTEHKIDEVEDEVEEKAESDAQGRSERRRGRRCSCRCRRSREAPRRPQEETTTRTRNEQFSDVQNQKPF